MSSSIELLLFCVVIVIPVVTQTVAGAGFLQIPWTVSYRSAQIYVVFSV